MPSITPSVPLVLTTVALFLLFAQPTHAFGAGNIASAAKIEGQNWRHGDIEDTLLTLLISRAAGGKKFSKMDVKRVYFGNWLRDYSQAVDVGTVKYVSAQAITLLLWILGFLSFGYGTKEFQVTQERLGCYRPEEHIDNPKDYADNQDARQYDTRLRGPVDERTELGINPQTGLKNYIASENLRITTSAGLIREKFGRSIQLGRQYARSKNEADLFEALRLLGTACHCLEDYSAHSNYTELALIEMGERGIFPHVGRETAINIPGARGPVYPIVTGTFGGVDFLHSVMGEFSDKATQSEIQELEGSIESQSGGANSSVLQDLLNQLPSGLLGGGDPAGKADDLQANATAGQMQNTHISPKNPEEFTRQIQEISKTQIYPIMEWHDDLMKNITETIEKIPVLPDLIEQVQDQINKFVFSLMAPFVLPIINQVKTELATGSSEIIQSSRDKQLIVFYEDGCSDPTHSMLSKDHFSNILNEPAGKIASQVLKWVVPQIIACWDDENIDVNRTLTRIVNGVFHHPAQAQMGDDGAIDGRRGMFGVVQKWWSEKSDYEKQTLRDQLSRDGVQNGRNHKEGVQDSGHGCGKPLSMPKATSGSGGAAGGVLGGIADALTESGGSNQFGKSSGGSSGLDPVNALVGGLVGAAGASLLGGAFGGDDDEKKKHKEKKYGDDGSYTENYTETAHAPSQGSYGQAQYQQTTYPSGVQRQEYQRYEQQETSSGLGGYSQQVVQESRPTYGGGYEQNTQQTYGGSDGQWQSQQRREGVGASGEYYSQSSNQGPGYGETRNDSGSDTSEKKRRKKALKKAEKEAKKQWKRQQEGYESGGSGSGSGSNRGGGGGYGEERREYGGGGGGYEQQERQGYGVGEYEQRQEQQYGGGGGGYEQREESSGGYEQREEYGGGGGGEGYGGGYEQREEREEYGGDGGY